MKLAIIYMGIFPPTKGYSGGDRRVHAIAQGLQLNGADTTLLAPKYHNAQNSGNQLLPFKVAYMGGDQSNPLLNRISFWKQTYQYLKSHKKNSVIFYGPVLDSIFLMLLLKISGIKVALELCDRISTAHKGWYGLWWRLSESWVPRFSQLNIVISKYLFDFAKQKNNSSPIITVPVLADPQKFSPNKNSRSTFLKNNFLPDNYTYLLYMGYMNTIEGVDLLLEAIQNLEVNNVMLLLAGNLDATDPSLVDVEGFIVKHKLQSKVKALGFLNTDQVIEVLNTADIVMLPQRNTEFNLAGLPTKVAEYAAMGKAIIGAPIGDIPVYFTHGENMFWVDDMSATNLKKSIEILANDLNLRNKLGENARKTALTHFTPTMAGKNILEAFEKLK